MDIPNQKIECVVIEYKKPKGELGIMIAKVSIMAAVFIICLNFISLYYVKQGFFMTVSVTSIGSLVALAIGIISGMTGLIWGLAVREKKIIPVALAGLILNVSLPAMGFVKNPVFGFQAEKKTIVLPSGRKVITQDWVSSAMTFGNNVIILDDSDFDKTVNGSNKVVLVDFWASWCKPCKMMAPVIDGLANEYKGKAKVCKLNVDESRKMAERFGIKSLPTIILFKYGQEYERWTGYTNSSEINSAIDKRLKE